MKIILLIIALILLSSIALADDIQTSFGNAGDNQFYVGPSILDNEAFFDMPGSTQTVVHGGGNVFATGNVISNPNITNINTSLPPPPEKIVKVSWANGIPVSWIVIGFIIILFFVLIFKKKKNKD